MFVHKFENSWGLKKLKMDEFDNNLQVYLIGS